MGKVFSSALGILGIGGDAKAPKVDDTALTALQSQQADAQKANQALYATEGGVLGSILTPGQTSTRNTLLGN